MTIFFIWLGAEAPNDVDMLYDAGVRDFGVSYASFKRRVRNVVNGLERFPDDAQLYLYDKSAWDTEASHEQLLEGAQQYEAFVAKNYGRFFALLEYDSPEMGLEWIQERRDAFYDLERYNESFWASWHPSYGLDHLKYLGESYTDVIVPVMALRDSRVGSLISNLKATYQTSFHCQGFSLDRENRPELFEKIFMSTWSSALKHGDLYVPYGKDWIRRLPKEDQQTSLRQYGDFIESLGCDPALLIEGNTGERELYTVRLFRWLESGHSAISEILSMSTPADAQPKTSAGPPLEPDSDDQSERKNSVPNMSDSSTIAILPRYTDSTLPSLTIEEEEHHRIDKNGVPTLSSVPIVRRSAESVRQCDTCMLSAHCPGFSAGASCKFKMPVQIRTREQMMALTEVILETQASRVLFASYAEEMSGYPDPSVGKEMDRFAKLATMFSKLGESRESLEIKASRTTQGGVLSRLFGERVREPRSPS